MLTNLQILAFVKPSLWRNEKQQLLTIRYKLLKLGQWPAQASVFNVFVEYL